MRSTSKREDLAAGGLAVWNETETGDWNMSTEKREKFDGYAEKYDEWFVKNANLFESELRLFKKALGDVSGQRLLSVGCGSGLFESCIGQEIGMAYLAGSGSIDGDIYGSHVLDVERV